ncbi:hypothetical protein GPALN_012811 [Globodera pallida]|nr:hypothetical protein GPALN_012811 [Globodera pallida]
MGIDQQRRRIHPMPVDQQQMMEIFDRHSNSATAPLQPFDGGRGAKTCILVDFPHYPRFVVDDVLWQPFVHPLKMFVPTVIVALTFLLLLPNSESATECNSKELLGTYLKCLKGELDRDYAGFEQELKEHTRRAAGACFAQSIGDANQNERCVLALADLDAKAWDRNGPLRECSICRTFATGAIKAILSTPADEQKCIREQISKAIGSEAESCLKKKVPDFSGPLEIPDLEEGAFAIREQVIDSISDYIWIHSRLAFCAERKPERAGSTQKCLKSPFLGYYQKHCQVLNSCDTAAAGSECLEQLRTSKTNVCECIDEAREDLKKRIAGIAEAIHEAVQGGSRAAPSIGSNSKVDQCVANIKKQLVTPVNDWAAIIDNALNNCIKNKPSSQSLGIDSLLNVGCRKIIADTSGSAQAQIKTGFEFVNNLIDSMVERSRRFCGGAHCGN